MQSPFLINPQWDLVIEITTKFECKKQENAKQSNATATK